MKSNLAIFFLFIIGCKSDDASPRIIDGYYTDARFNKNMKLEGHVKFYDTVSNKLAAEGDYTDGVKNGEYKQYNSNGILIVDLFYVLGKENGIVKMFDDSGNLVSKDDYYFGLRSGNAIKYKNNKLFSYAFYSLENDELFYFEYDSLKGKRLAKLFPTFIFLYSVDFGNSLTDSTLNREYFLYTPNPPLYSFEYSLVKVNKSLKILSTIKKFDMTRIWSKFEISAPYKTDTTNFAIKFNCFEPVNDSVLVMLKVLK